METKYEQIVDVSKIGKRAEMNLDDIAKLAKKEKIEPASNIKRLLLCIDVQNDFIEGGALPVPGSIGDVERITRFIYNNISNISCIMCSLDTHIPMQIFHPCWWMDSEGNNPAPYTIITYDDVINGRWLPAVCNTDDSVEYLRELEKVGSGKKKLCIWPYHCIEGIDGHLLENEFTKMMYFHSKVCSAKERVFTKGEDPYSEMYGIIKPEYSKEDYCNMIVIDAIKEYDEIYVVGEAASHCVLASVEQIAEYFASQPEITSKITVLEDCTSPIPGFEAETQAAFEKLKQKYGVKFAKSTDIRL